MSRIDDIVEKNLKRLDRSYEWSYIKRRKSSESGKYSKRRTGFNTNLKIDGFVENNCLVLDIVYHQPYYSRYGLFDYYFKGNLRKYCISLEKQNLLRRMDDDGNYYKLTNIGYSLVEEKI